MHLVEAQPVQDWRHRATKASLKSCSWSVKGSKWQLVRLLAMTYDDYIVHGDGENWEYILFLSLPDRKPGRAAGRGGRDGAGLGPWPRPGRAAGPGRSRARTVDETGPGRAPRGQDGAGLGPWPRPGPRGRDGAGLGPWPRPSRAAGPGRSRARDRDLASPSPHPKPKGLGLFLKAVFVLLAM